MSFPATGIGSGVLGFRPHRCPSPFPSPSILGVFHSPLYAIGFQSCFFFIATHSVDPSLTHFLGECPGLGLALVPDDVVPEAEHGAWSRKLDPNFKLHEKMMQTTLDNVCLTVLYSAKQYNIINTDYRSSEPLKTLIMLCYVMLCYRFT